MRTGLLTNVPDISRFVEFVRRAPQAIQDATGKEEGLWIRVGRRPRPFELSAGLLRLHRLVHRVRHLRRRKRHSPTRPVFVPTLVGCTKILWILGGRAGFAAVPEVPEAVAEDAAAQGGHGVDAGDGRVHAGAFEAGSDDVRAAGLDDAGGDAQAGGAERRVARGDGCGGGSRCSAGPRRGGRAVGARAAARRGDRRRIRRGGASPSARPCRCRVRRQLWRRPAGAAGRGTGRGSGRRRGTARRRSSRSTARRRRARPGGRREVYRRRTPSARCACRRAAC